MSRRAIQSALQSTAHRVERFLVEARKRQQDTPRYQYTGGEMHPFMGRWLALDLHRDGGRRARVELCDEKIRIHTSDTESNVLRAVLGAWYRQQAARHFAERLAIYCEDAPWARTKLPQMRLRLMKRTWGSCSRGGTITLNPHLIKAPPVCIDYVIAHEVCHLAEHNHGKGFYALQGQLFPRWREAKAHLRNRGYVYLVR